MKFSVSVLPLPDRASKQPLRRLFEQCELAEELGFHSVVLGQHHFHARSSYSDPLSLFCAIAARTTELRLATGIFLMPLSNPLEVAERVATLDVISGGRVSFGVGVGWNTAEYEALGVDFAHRGDRMDEAVALLRRLLGEENVSARGRFWRFPPLTIVPRPVQTPHPPILISGKERRPIERAARLGDAWLCAPSDTFEEVVQMHEYYVGACARAGRIPSWVLRRYVLLCQTQRELEDRLPAVVASNLKHWRDIARGGESQKLFERLDNGERVSAVEIAAPRLIAGTAEQVIAGIERYREATGVNHMSIGFGGGTTDRAFSDDDREIDDVCLAMRRFSRDVMPAFAAR